MPCRCWVLCIYTAFLAGIVDSFLQVPRIQKSAPEVRFRMPMAMTPQATQSTSTPNWRVLESLSESKGGKQEEIKSTLREREAWSDQQHKESLELYDKFICCTDSYVAPGIHDALNCLDHAYRLYGPESVINSFNGGKDAEVILQLVRAAHAHYYNGLEKQGADVTPVRPRTIYFDHEDEFTEVLEHLNESVTNYDLDMIAFPKGVKFSDGLKLLVDNNFPAESERPFPMAFVLGTRIADPNSGSQGYFAPSSHYMPPFMRVNPILEWTYGQVWHFLRLFSLPYCVLYDQGYTSLGTTKDTLPCPALAVPGNNTVGDGTLPKYWPAYMLQDWSQERAGRVKKDKNGKKKANEAPKKSSKVAAVVPQSVPGSDPDSMISEETQDLRDTDPKEMDQFSHANQVSSTGSTGVPEIDDSQSCISFASNYTAMQRTAGLLIIGDEILKGAAADTNTQAAAKAFRENAILLKRVVVVSDNQDDIVNEIIAMQDEVDVLVTSGGVGPTHDDVTIKSIAVALERDLELNNEMAEVLKDRMNNGEDTPLTEAQIKMATLPARSKLKYLSDHPKAWPVLQCKNIFILPGVPEFFSSKIESVATYVSSDGLERSSVYKVVLSVDESKIVSVLDAAVKKHPDVMFGSYPFVSHPEFKTVLTIEGKLVSTPDPDDGPQSRKSFTKAQMDHHVRLALDYLVTNLPNGSILRVENDDTLL